MHVEVKISGDYDFLYDLLEDQETALALSSSHFFKYDDATTVQDLVDFIIVSSKFYKDYDLDKEFILSDFIYRFKVLHCEELLYFNLKNEKLISFIDLICRENILVIIPEIPIDGGLGILREEGYEFIIHTNERNHRFDPHVHVRKNGEEIRVGLDEELTVINKGKMKKQEIKKAKKIISTNFDCLLAEYNRVLSLSNVGLETYEQRSFETKKEMRNSIESNMLNFECE